MDVDKNKLIRWLQELIRIPSVTGEEGSIANYVSQELFKMGFKPQKKDNNIFFEIGNGSKSLLVNAHLDTVGICGKWGYDPFGAVMENGRIFGRGASDDKGNIATMLEIARQVRNISINGRLIFTFTTGEEFGADIEKKGSYLLAQELNAQKALVLEPQTDVSEKKINIIYGCRGIKNFLIQIKGKASHTGYSERGVNAIYSAVQVLEKLQKIEYDKVLVADQEIKTVCMPIRINGGANIFIVPDKCEIMLHCRTTPEDVRISKKIELMCQEVCGKNFDIQITYNAPSYIENPNDTLVNIIHREAQQCNYSAQNRFAGGRIDASIFKTIGNIPSFCTGAGDRDQMHLVDEYITIDDFITCSKMLTNVVFSYLS